MYAVAGAGNSLTQPPTANFVKPLMTELQLCLSPIHLSAADSFNILKPANCWAGEDFLIPSFLASAATIGYKLSVPKSSMLHSLIRIGLPLSLLLFLLDSESQDPNLCPTHIADFPHRFMDRVAPRYRAKRCPKLSQSLAAVS